jgi:H+/Cl- antiporter ClcA
MVARPGLMTLALAIGADAGAGAVLFRHLILSFTIIFSGHADYSATPHAPHPAVPFLGLWFVVLAPAIGGLIYGPLVERFVREARGHGVPEVMLAVAERGGRIRPQVAVVKALASALCIGSGGSLGREGPIVQIEEAIRENALDTLVGELADETPPLRATQSLEEAVRLLVRRVASGLPVTSSSGAIASRFSSRRATRTGWSSG